MAIEPGRAKAARVGAELQEGTMTVAQTTGPMSPGLLKVAERAKRDPKAQFNSLAHLIDEEALKAACGRLRKDAAVGVDGISVEEYRRELLVNIRSLHERMKSGRYRHQPILRVHIPKEKGRTRPIGISSVEDKIVQGAVREVLEAIYEPAFLDCSYGFRPGRSAHDALRTLNSTALRGEMSWVLETDIQSFFDSLDRKRLMEMLRERVVDGSMLRLVGKCLNAGVLDGEEFTVPDAGTVQGSILSPLLGNIYLHSVLDLWFERDVRPRLKGRALLVRYADDLVIAFERRDAEKVMGVLPLRLGRFGLSLHPEKTRLVPFARPPFGTRGKGPGTFDFLGFTLHWGRTMRGTRVLRLKTRRSRLRRSITAVAEWCRCHRHLPVNEQRDALTRRLVGHYAYYGVNGNSASLAAFYHHARRAWCKWLRRRSNRTRLTWARFRDLLEAFPLPPPRICVQIWARTP